MSEIASADLCAGVRYMGSDNSIGAAIQTIKMILILRSVKAMLLPLLPNNQYGNL